MSQSPPLEATTENHTVQQQLQIYHLLSINSTMVINQLPSQGISFQIWPIATALVTLLDQSCLPSNTTGPLSSLFSWERRLRVLELGSGTGVVGIAAAALLGASVTVTDLPHVLPNLQLNVDANAGMLKLHGGTVDVASLSWGNTADMEAESMTSYWGLIWCTTITSTNHCLKP